MNKRIKLFKILELETSSLCNYKCKRCMRQTFPDREAIQSWFKMSLMSPEIMMKAFQGAKNLGFTGTVCISHRNEPMLDPCIGIIADIAKSYGFSLVKACTNGAVLTPKIIKKVDGTFDELDVAVYLRGKAKDARQAEIADAFKKTRINFTSGKHEITNHGPDVTEELLNSKRNLPCAASQLRMIINHMGDMELCCGDFGGLYNLGNIHNKTIEQLWYSDLHQDVVEQLEKPFGRHLYSNCMLCPRGKK